MPFLIKFLPEIAAVVLCLSIYAVGYTKGNASCGTRSARQDTVAVKNEVARNDKIDIKNKMLPTPAIYKLLDKWVRPN